MVTFASHPEVRLLSVGILGDVVVFDQGRQRTRYRTSHLELSPRCQSLDRRGKLVGGLQLLTEGARCIPRRNTGQWRS
jgi:hypothetical protein